MLIRMDDTQAAPNWPAAADAVLTALNASGHKITAEVWLHPFNYDPDLVSKAQKWVTYENLEIAQGCIMGSV